jgi:hypothetical protein
MDLRRSGLSHFKCIRFVTPVSSAVDASCSARHEGTEPKLQLDGKEIKEFYEKLVHSNSETERSAGQATKSKKTCSNSLHARKTQRCKNVLSSPKVKVKDMKKSHTNKLGDTEQNKLNQDLLLFSQNGELKKVTKLVKQGADVNTIDMFGWTPIMCACHSGSFSVTEYLLCIGARTDVKNLQGHTAIDLAKIAHRQKILDLFNGKGDNVATEGVEKTVERFFCDKCGREFSDTTKKQHESSTVHLFNLSKPSRPTVYLIPETSPGYQIMVKGGWDTEKGLGPTGQGRKFPVKTTLKMDRAGIGIKTDAKPRVTHPAPQISGEGVKPSTRHPRDGSNSRKAIKKKEKIKEKQWERNLRMALTLD